MTNCLINQVPGEFDIPDFCHVYSAGAWHEDAFIVAGTDALLKIKDTIDKALETGQSSCALFVNDGESFELIIIKADKPSVKNNMKVPYTDASAASKNGIFPNELVAWQTYMTEKELRESLAHEDR